MCSSLTLSIKKQKKQMAPPDTAVALPLPAPLDVSLPMAAAPSPAASARLRLNAAIAGISAALQELNSTVDALGGELKKRGRQRESNFSRGERARGCVERGERMRRQEKGAVGLPFALLPCPPLPASRG